MLTVLTQNSRSSNGKEIAAASANDEFAVLLRRVHPRVVHWVGGKLVEMVDPVSDISARVANVLLRPTGQRHSPWQTRLWRCAAGLFVLVAVAAGGWLMREPLLREAADLWIVSDPISRADAIVVLSGGLPTRPFEAAELWQRGLADKILISQPSEERAVSTGAMPSHSELNREILLKLGVPGGVIETFGTANQNTRDEAVSLREWAERNAASAFIIPTEIFPARRVRWIFRREFSGTAVKIVVLSFDPPYLPPYFTRREWWKTEHGVVAFQNEVLKYIYYRLKY